MTKPLQIAIVGCGRMGKQHAASCAKHGAQVCLVCDPDAERAKQLATSCPGANVATSPETIDWTGLDAAFICTPPFARGPVEQAAAARGVSLFMEKPVGLSREIGQQIADAARKAGVLTSVGYMNRYRDSVRQAKKLADAEGLVGVVCHWVAGVYRVPWWGKRELSGGQINEQCTHFIDLIRFFCGEIAEVAAMSQPGPAGDELDIDLATTALLRSEKGPLATMIASCASQTKQIGFYVFTRERQINLDGWDLALRGGEAGDKPGDIFGDEAAAFLRAVETRDASLILSPLDDALKTQVVIDSLIGSLESHASVRAPRSTSLHDSHS